MNTTECQEILLFGNCTKGELCEQCNKTINSANDDKNVLNVNSKEFIPKKKKNNSDQSKPKDPNVVEIDNKTLKLNLNANEYVPTGKKYNELSSYPDPNAQTLDDADDLEPNPDEMEMIVKDMIENEQIEEEEGLYDDEDQFFSKYKDCECCKGKIYKCNGDACQYLGACYCKVKTDCDDANN